MVRLLVYDKVERIWKEVAGAVAWRDWEKPRKTSVRVAGALGNIQTSTSVVHVN
jgi:hypothetical protein